MQNTQGSFTCPIAFTLSYTVEGHIDLYSAGLADKVLVINYRFVGFIR